MSEDIRLRFAPSPTGPLHIGGLRTALYNYLIAKNLNGKFILRIEDTDLSRFNPKAEEHIIKSLIWCGLNPDESPEDPGKYGPYRQSERQTIYKKYVESLIDKGDAYYAFDKKEDLDELRKKDEKKGKTFIYNWENRKDLKNSISLSNEETNLNIKKGNYVIRYKIFDQKNKEENIFINDKIRGEISVDRKLLDDKIIFKNDGMPTYHFANVVDDHLMKISHVVRGEEWLPSLALHISLYESFGWEKPIYAHLPLILKPTGKGKLSKRDGEKFGIPIYPIEWKDENETYSGFKELGFEEGALINFISLVGWNPGNEKELYSIQELINDFKLERIIKSGAKYDYNKALWFNQEYIKNISSEKINENLGNKIKTKMNGLIDSDKVLNLIDLVKERVQFKKDIFNECIVTLEYSSSLFNNNIGFFKNIKNIKSILTELHNQIKDEKNKNIKEIYFSILNKNNIKIGIGMKCLRLCITGRDKGPDLFQIINILKRKEITERLSKSLKIIND